MSLEEVERLLQREVTGVLQPLDVDLEGLTVRSVGHRVLVRVLVDKDDGISLDEVAQISKSLSLMLDTSNPLGERPYTLEVSSPGTERPLTAERHWRRNTGRKVRVRFIDGSEPVTGRIRSASESSVTLDVHSRQCEIGYDQVEKAIIQVELKSNSSSRDRAKREST